MVSYIPTEKATPIRMPATANLMIDSYDRNSNYPDAGSFTIQKNASILNGFFTRIATTEVVLEWAVPNIVEGYNANIFITVGVTEEEIILPQGFYTVKLALDTIVTKANEAFPLNTFSILQDGGDYYLKCIVTAGGAAQIFTFETYTLLLADLGFTQNVSASQKLVGENQYPDIRYYRYLDFVSSDLTYAQDLKDSSTANQVRDVLCRWYFVWDTQPQLDGYGFPILQGYTAFQQRRLFNPPKQIRWEPNLPIGNLSFQVYGKLIGVDDSELVSDRELDSEYNWLMTLQVSES